MGCRVADIMATKGMSHSQLLDLLRDNYPAIFARLDYSTLNRIVRGKTEPHVMRALAIANTLGVKVEEVYYHDPEHLKRPGEEE